MRFHICFALAVVAVVTAPNPVAAQNHPRNLTEFSDSFESLVARTSPAVVEILATGYGVYEGRTTIQGMIGRKRSSGSGVILHPDGYIVTNAHVVEGATRVQVTLPLEIRGHPGKSIVKPEGRRVGAQLIGVDRETDLAVLKVPQRNLPHLELGDSDDLRQGQLVFAFGSPYGLENSVSMGIVSSVTRQLRPEDPMIYIQTDATINPGNSGGPLVDTEGKVVGINTMIVSHAGGSEGVGFAAPANIVRNIYEQFRETGRVRRGQIGVKAQTITPLMAAALGIDREWGVILGDVYPGGPAEQAGLRTGDIVLTLDGKPMENGRQFEVNLYQRVIGDVVTLEVRRGARTQQIRVAVVEREDDPARFADFVRPEENLIPKIGILGLDLDRSIMPLLPPLRREDGVVVAARAADAPYSNDGLMPGDVIHTLNRSPVRDLQELRDEVRKLRSGDAVVCHVERSGQLLFVAFECD